MSSKVLVTIIVILAAAHVFVFVAGDPFDWKSGGEKPDAADQQAADPQPETPTPPPEPVNKEPEQDDFTFDGGQLESEHGAFFFQGYQEFLRRASDDRIQEVYAPLFASGENTQDKLVKLRALAMAGEGLAPSLGDDSAAPQPQGGGADEFTKEEMEAMMEELSADEVTPEEATKAALAELREILNESEQAAVNSILEKPLEWTLARELALELEARGSTLSAGTLESLATALSEARHAGLEGSETLKKDNMLPNIESRDELYTYVKAVLSLKNRLTEKAGGVIGAEKAELLDAIMEAQTLKGTNHVAMEADLVLGEYPTLERFKE